MVKVRKEALILGAQQALFPYSFKQKVGIGILVTMSLFVITVGVAALAVSYPPISKKVSIPLVSLGSVSLMCMIVLLGYKARSQHYFRMVPTEKEKKEGYIERTTFHEDGSSTITYLGAH